jgi:hypothetical protein
MKKQLSMTSIFKKKAIFPPKIGKNRKISDHCCQFMDVRVSRYKQRVLPFFLRILIKHFIHNRHHRLWNSNLGRNGRKICDQKIVHKFVHTFDWFAVHRLPFFYCSATNPVTCYWV